MTTDAELDLMLAGEDTFVSGGVSASTYLMEHDAVMGESPQAAGVVCGAGYVLVRASLFPDLRTDDDCTLNDTAYTVATKMRIQDGKVLQVGLGSANG